MSRASILGTLGLSGFNSLGTLFTSQGSTIRPSFSAVGTIAGTGVNSIQERETSSSMQLKRIDAVTTNRVVTLSAIPGLCDIQAADWTTGRNVSDWSTLQAYLSATAYSNRNISASASYIEFYGNSTVFPGSNLMDGGVLHPNGKIYTNGTSSTTWSVMRVIDPNTNSVSTFNALGQGAARYGSSSAPVLAPNGRIFFVPYERTFCMYFDPTTNTFSTFAGFDAGAGNATLMNCGALAPNGKIYFAPFDDTVFRFLDPDALTIQAYATITGNTPSSHYYGAVLGPNGKIYFIPSYTSLFRAVDPSTNTVQVIGTITGSTNNNNYASGVLVS